LLSHYYRGGYQKEFAGQGIERHCLQSFSRSRFLHPGPRTRDECQRDRAWRSVPALFELSLGRPLEPEDRTADILDNATAVGDTVDRLIADTYSGRIHSRIAGGLGSVINWPMPSKPRFRTENHRFAKAVSGDFDRRVAKIERRLAADFERRVAEFEKAGTQGGLRMGRQKLTSSGRAWHGHGGILLTK
jgi:hypothetical protein